MPEESTWQDTLSLLKFRERGSLGAMRAVLEGVEFIAIPHPWKGLSLSATYVSADTIGDAESFVPIDAPVEMITEAMLRMLQELRPEFREGHAV